MAGTPPELKKIFFPFATSKPSNSDESSSDDKLIDNKFFSLFGNNSKGSLNNVSGGSDNNGEDIESLRKTKSEPNCSNLVSEFEQVTIEEHEVSDSIEEITEESSGQDPLGQDEPAASGLDKSTEDNVVPEFLESLKLKRNSSSFKRKKSSNQDQPLSSMKPSDYDETLDNTTEHSKAMDLAEHNDSPKRVRKIITNENDPSSSVSRLQFDGFESNEPVNYLQTPSAIAEGSSVGEAGDQSSQLNDSDIKNNRYSNASTVEFDEVCDS